ncbi:Aldehyde oxidase 2 [Hibiscus syriacus]|uniref:Aldehyde oxidase 2 n=1 Tax=Hibiscus syriacus TaxID=106335 RepID=A0A6A2ZDY9_HIBSY|nr:Aldehyde oxidase 2 [Hibiscus syriacus]
MEKIALRFIRNSGSVGGNLMIAQRKHFPSDIAIILFSMDTIVEIMTSQSRLQLTLEEFLGRPPLDLENVLLSIKMPYLESSTSVSSDAQEKLLFETYRAASRSLGNALPYLNSTFLAQLSQSPTGFMLNNCWFAFGVYGTKHAIRVKEVEEFLNGKLLSISVLYEAFKFLETLVIHEDGTSSPVYRSNLAVGFFFEFLIPSTDSEHEQIESQRQKLELSSKPLVKLFMWMTFHLQKIAYIGAFIYSTEPRARVKGIKLDPIHLYAVGQQIAFVVADSQKNSDIVANLAMVEYDKENLEPPILSVEEAVERAFIRKFNMIMSGGRHSMKITYRVGCKSNKKIIVLKLDILLDAGMFVDESPIMSSHILGSLGKYDWGALSFDIKLCKTNFPSRGALRAPRDVHASYRAEAVIEHVASYLSMEVDSVRNINLHNYNSLNFFPSAAGKPLEYTLPSIWRGWPLLQAFTTGPRWFKNSIGFINGRSLTE